MENNNFLNINSQNKLIMFGTLLSSILIVLLAWFVINNSQKTILNNYHDFGIMMTKTLSVDGSEIIKENKGKSIYNKLALHSDYIADNNKDISYIIYTDTSGNIIYSNKNKFHDKNSKTINISQPIIDYSSPNKDVLGQVNIAMTGHTMKDVGNATRNLMLIIFSIAWILSITAVFINTFLMTRQISLLSLGVKKISSGEFGYKIPSKDLWGEIKELFDSFNNMSVRLRQYEEKNIDQLTYEKNKLEAVLMSIANGVVVCGKHDEVILANNAAVKMLDVKVHEILDTKIVDFCDSNGNICFKEKIQEFKETPLELIEAKTFKFQTQAEDKILMTIISPIFTINREYLGYILVFRDITKEREIEKMKDTFISNVSHELRTPVTVIRSYIDTLYSYGNEFDEETKNEFIGIMNTEADRLNRMVNDILDFSRLESPNVQIEKTNCDIKPIIDLTVSSMKVLLDEKNMQTSVIVEPELPRVSMNGDSIERVLKNYISNAIKYSHNNGRIKIKAEIDRTGNYLEVSVEDNGLGIPREHLPKIFDRFYRVENKSHQIKGTGLGLHIAKIAIEKHHSGEVFVYSEPNIGSTFGFRIPLTPLETKEEELV